jgi:hypothetical protein
MVEETFKKIIKKFSAYPESWTRFAEFYLKKGDVDAARALLPRSLKSLDKSKRKLIPSFHNRIPVTPRLHRWGR